MIEALLSRSNIPDCEKTPGLSPYAGKNQCANHPLHENRLRASARCSRSTRAASFCDMIVGGTGIMFLQDRQDCASAE